MENTALAYIVETFGFKRIMKDRPKVMPSYALRIENGSNCEFTVLLFLLNDSETIRVSILEDEDNDPLGYSVDLFESKSEEKITSFINMLL